MEDGVIISAIVVNELPPADAPSTVLVVDDSPINLEVMMDYLATQGLRVVIARDGEEALRQAELMRPDIILLDVMMPKMDGFEVCRRLKGIADLRKTPVIFMTALTDSEDKIRGFEAGGVDFVTKPIEMHELRARVTAHLRVHTMQKQLAARNAELERYREGLEKLVAARTEELDDRNRQLGAEVSERQRLQRAFLSATDHEQRRLARELHDGLGQDLVGLGMLLQGAMNDVKSGRLLTTSEINRMSLVAGNALKTCHDIAHGLSPLTSTPGGLLEALHALKTRIGGPPGPSVELDIDGDCTLGLASETCDHLYRIAQEAATNAIKHARANRVTIKVRVDGHGIRLEVSDDGCGIKQAPGQRIGLGLHTMLDRAAGIGATLQLLANPGGGTRVVCHAPQFCAAI
jgi:signal transduction histidine kinase